MDLYIYIYIYNLNILKSYYKMFKRVFNGYFIINSFVILLFPILSIIMNYDNLFKEANLLLSLIVLFVLKYIRAYSPENFLLDYFFYAKLLTFGFLFTSNRPLSFWFLFACFG